MYPFPLFFPHKKKKHLFTFFRLTENILKTSYFLFLLLSLSKSNKLTINGSNIFIVIQIYGVTFSYRELK